MIGETLVCSDFQNTNTQKISHRKQKQEQNFEKLPRRGPLRVQYKTFCSQFQNRVNFAFLVQTK